VGLLVIPLHCLSGHGPFEVPRWQLRRWQCPTCGHRAAKTTTSRSAPDVVPYEQLLQGRPNTPGARFRRARGSGYSVRDVDEFLDQLAAAEANSITPREIEQKEFREERRGGYNIREVDEFLDQLAAQVAAAHPEEARRRHRR
jgi:DivIVA domain-containing protein